MPMVIRYISGVIFLVLAFYALLEGGLSSIPRLLLFFGLIAASVLLVLKAAVELFTVAFVHSARRVGRGLGRLVAIVRQESRN